MIGWGIAAAVLLLIAFLPVGAAAKYGADGYWVKIAAGPFRFALLPPKEKPDREKKTRRKRKTPEKAETERKDESPEKGGPAVDLIELVRTGIAALRRFSRRIVIRRLIVHFTAASPNPASAALQYGGGWALCGTLTALLSHAFRVRKTDLKPDMNFDLESPTVYAYADLRIAVWAILEIAIVSGFRLLKSKVAGKAPVKPAQTNQGKVETANG